MKNKQESYSTKMVEHPHKQANKQAGIVLLWAVIFLLIITIVGLAAVRMSGMDTQIAGNSMSTMLTFQGAESTLARAGQFNYINKVTKLTPKQLNAEIADESIGSASLESNANVSFEAEHQGCSKNEANSSKLKCTIFRIRGNSRIKGSNVRAQHVMGWAELEPQP